MSYRLYVRPLAPYAGVDETPEGQLFNWVLHDASGGTQAHGTGDSRETIEQTLAQNALENVRLIGLIPGEDAVFCLADIPAKQQRFILQALPYAVEEQVAQDIDTVHLALGKHTGSGYRVAAIDRGRMSHWLALYRDWEHAVLDAIYPDAALLPTTDQGWTICLDGEAAMLISDRGEWLAMQAANLAMFAQTLAIPSTEEVAAEVPVRVFGTAEALERHQAVLAELRAIDRLSVADETLDLMPLELLAHAHHHHHCEPINLCQGPFLVKTGQDSPLKPWRPLIAVASLWFVVQVALEAGMGFYYQQQAETLSTQAMAVYREAFPNDRRTNAGNVRRVIEGQLRVAGSSGPEVDFITLMKHTGQQYSRLSESGALTFNSLNYTRSRGELVVDLRADSYDRLSRLRNGLSEQGLEAQIGSVVNESGGARARLTVSGG